MARRNIDRTIDMITAVGNDKGLIGFSSREIAPAANFVDMLGCHVTMQTPNGWAAYCDKRQDPEDKSLWHFTVKVVQSHDGGVRPVPKGTQVGILITLHGEVA